jgi:uncharacterized protein (TIGR02117 family)
MQARFRWLAAVTVVGLAIAVLGLGGCAYFKDWEQLPATATEERAIFVVSHGWHTGVVVAREHLGPLLAFVPPQLGDAAFYEFGWGDKNFYQTEGFHFGVAAKAVLWPTPTTMHVVALKQRPELEFPLSTTVPLYISTAGESKLIAAIAASFAKNEQGESPSTRDGLYGHSRFFDANGKYHAFSTCNTWTARMLAQAGVPTTTVLTLTAGSVVRQSRWAANKYRCCKSGRQFRGAPAAPDP